MKELELQSSLSIEQIEENFKNVNLFEGIMEGLNEAVAYEQGTAKSETIIRKRSLPDVNVVEVRNSLSMTQKSFAAILGVSCRTVESWESGRTTPTPTAKKLMFLINQDHSLVQKLQAE